VPGTIADADEAARNSRFDPYFTVHDFRVGAVTVIPASVIPVNSAGTVTFAEPIVCVLVPLLVKVTV
jgi:hypothetical protein